VLAAGDTVTSRRTAVVVAHRLATAARADRIVVLHGGRIAEQGRPADLLAAGGRFTRLWEAGELEPPADAESNDTDLDQMISDGISA
jgi:ATP-binding cassette subfamily B protein